MRVTFKRFRSSSRGAMTYKLSPFTSSTKPIRRSLINHIPHSILSHTHLASSSPPSLVIQPTVSLQNTKVGLRTHLRLIISLPGGRIAGISQSIISRVSQDRSPPGKDPALRRIPTKSRLSLGSLPTSSHRLAALTTKLSANCGYLVTGPVSVSIVWYCSQSNGALCIPR